MVLGIILGIMTLVIVGLASLREGGIWIFPAIFSFIGTGILIAFFFKEETLKGGIN